jgi:hypothetical protein
VTPAWLSLLRIVAVMMAGLTVEGIIALIVLILAMPWLGFV